MRERKGREYWLAAIRRFEASDISQAAFCAQRRLNVGTFRSWLYRLRDEGVVIKPIKATKFHEVDRVKLNSANASSCVVRVGQVEVEFHGSPSVVYLSDLVTNLRSLQQ